MDPDLALWLIFGGVLAIAAWFGDSGRRRENRRARALNRLHGHRAAR